MEHGKTIHGGGVILHDARGRVLLQHRDAGAPRYPLFWGLFGGAAEGSETAAEAVVREIREELGLKLRASDLRPICELPVESRGVPGVAHYFSAPLRVPVESLRLMEGDGMELFSREELAGLHLIPNARIALGRFFEQDPSGPLSR